MATAQRPFALAITFGRDVVRPSPFFAFTIAFVPPRTFFPAYESSCFWEETRARSREMDFVMPYLYRAEIFGAVHNWRRSALPAESGTVRPPKTSAGQLRFYRF